MKTISRLLSILISLLFIIPVIQAQEFDEKPSEPVLGTWYKENPLFTYDAKRTTHPLIINFISQVSSDSIRSTIQKMQDFGTRFMLADNRKDVATWILKKFQSFGYTDVKIDSFLNYVNWQGIFIDTTWQYNVICEVTGNSAPDEVYIAGGHYDSFCAGDPFVIAPGANDNATAVAATLEIARVMKKNDYQPEATIKFILYGAEELGLFGSRYQAQKSRENGEDIRYMLNLDMVSNNPNNRKDVKIYKYIYFEWAANLAAEVMENYTDLNVFFPSTIVATGSDAFPYWLNQFPVAYLEEMDFSPNWHKLSDTIGNCNIDYCAEITRGACAILMDQQFLPYPQGFNAMSTKENITLRWRPTNNSNVAGFNLYRSEQSGSGYSKLNSVPIKDSIYLDQEIPAGKQYYYTLKVVNDSMEESPSSQEVFGARFAFSDTLLVVACLQGDQLTPDSIFQFYQSVLDTIPFHWFDMNVSNPLDLGPLSRHQNVLWLLNSFNFELLTDTLAFSMSTFFENGGNMFFSGFTPTKYLARNSHYPQKFTEQFFINRYFKVDSVNRKINSFMYQSYPEEAGYDTLHVDPGKWMEKTLPGELYNIEVFTPAPGGKIIYRFDSHYDSTSTMGAMQGKAVGLEYMGNDFKTILLSFPLYYLDTTDAKNLMKYVMKNKFSHPTVIPVTVDNGEHGFLQNFPNPFREMTTLCFSLPEPGNVVLSVYNSQGTMVSSILTGKMDKGSYTMNYAAGNLPAGIYYVVLKTSGTVLTRKIVIVK